MAKAANPGPLGKRLKSIRTDRGWTLADVACRTGISPATLSKLERGQTSLTFNSASKLAEGLRLPIASLTTPGRKKTTARRSLTRLGGGTRFEGHDLDYEVLCNDLADVKQGFLRVTVKIRSANEQPEWRRHAGQEFVHVLKGTLILHTESYDPLTLQAGDSVVFDSEMGHKYVSGSKANAELLVIMQLEGYRDIEDAIDEISTA